MWKPDELAKWFDKTVVSVALHRYAGKTWNLSCMPRRSHLTGGYTAEINHWTPAGMVNNVALGNGPNPVAAALDGYRRCQDDIMWLVFDLELQSTLLRRTLAERRATERHLEKVIDLLTDVIRMVNTAA